MKNWIVSIIIISGLIGVQNTIVAQESVASFDELTLTVKGNVVNTVEKVKEFGFNVFENGKVIYSHHSTNGKFEYRLPYNSSVMIEFMAEGHYTKRIALATNSKARLGDSPTLSMTMTLISTARYPELQKVQDLLDFPAAFITYDRAGVSYDKNEDFSRVINDALIKVIPGIDYSDSKLASLDW